MTREQMAVVASLPPDAPLSMILEECEAWGVDPDPVVLCVRREAPELVFVFEDGQPVFRRGPRYVSIYTKPVWLGTSALLQAMRGLRAMLPPFRLVTRYEGDSNGDLPGLPNE